ncbi:hypothetical protein CKAH01_19056 [Colletotrichum kahawae]|uniref:Uncharacterized protein n=1 Tax=Colletotrichum kahawae TaxID=34407 RepID=A0AAD9Y285_COLKA|nr:hypothetical protein CKAH01_19056 [Colletotrichum kahawae]
MTNPPPGEQVHTYAKSAKDKVRKSGTSAERKIIQLGETSQVFSTVVYFNPTHERLEGAVYVPEGQYMPDVNGFLVELLKDSCDKGPGHGPRRAQTDRQLRQPSRATVRSEGHVRTGSSEVGAAAEETAHANTAVSQAHDNSVGINGAGCAGEAAIGHDGIPHAAARHGERRAEDWPQVDRRMADDSNLRNAGRCVVKQEMPDGAVADGTRRAAPLASLLSFGAGGVSEKVEAGYKVEDERSGDVSEWETVDAQDTRVPAARVTRAGLFRAQAAKVQRFLQQVSLHMRLASRQGRLPPYRTVHQDRWRGLSQRNRRW